MDHSALNKSVSQYRVCNFCEAMCGVHVNYDPSAASPEKTITVKPDPRDPFSKGSMCPKAPVLGPLHVDENRLRWPVKRTESGWAEISWDEAYSTIEEKLKAIRDRHGSDAIATYLGNPIVHNLGMLLFAKTLTGAIGSRNVYSATSMDQLPHHFAAHFMFGHEFRIPVPDIDRTDHMIVMGANPIASNGSIMTSAGVTERLHAIQKRGGKFVVIDPRKTETAKVASEHHFIRPGTDVFFLLAFLHIIFRDGRVRLGRLSAYLRDFDQLEPLAATFTPGAVTPIIGLDATTIERLAQEFLDRKRAVLYGRMGLSTQPHGGLCHWLINCINIVTGNFDSPGGMMFPSPAIELVRTKTQPDSVGRWQGRTSGLGEFYGELPVSGMTDEFLTDGEGQARAFVTICGNPVLSTPGGSRLDEALENVDFMVSIDNYINETTRHADIILPTPTGLEVDHYDLIFNTISVSNNAKFSEALFPTMDGRPYDWQVLKELSRRLSPSGLSLFDRWTTPRRLVNWGLMLGPYGKLSHPKRWFNGLTLGKVIASEHGISLGPLRSRVPDGLTTPDRKIHMAPDIMLARLRQIHDDEFPALVRKGEQQRQADDFTLVGRRNVNTNNSWMHQFEKLSRSKLVRCTVMMSPEDADRISTKDGDDVQVTSRVGAITLPVEVTDTMMQGVVSIPHGFGHTRPGTRIPIAEAKPGVSVNDITDPMRVDPLTGNAAFSGLQVTIKSLVAASRDVEVEGKPLTVIYGSRTGNAEFIAQDVAKEAVRHGMVAAVLPMDEIGLEQLSQAERVLVICSTYGEGDMPDNAQQLWEEALSPSAHRLENTAYSVLVLGDTSYETFCQAGRDWDQKLSELGARRLADRIDCDVDYVDAAAGWIETALPIISETGDQTVTITAGSQAGGKAARQYNRDNPLIAELTEKRLLTKTGSTKATYHYELSHPGLGTHYEAGDVINVIPRNRRELVDDLLQVMAADGDIRLDGFDRTLRERLTEDVEIRTPSRALVVFIAENSGDKTLQDLLKADEPRALTDFLADHDILDLLKLYPNAKPDMATLIDMLRPLTPRSYSISSSPNAHEDEVYLTVATVRYEAGGRQHHGVGSTYLADMVELGELVQCYFVSNRSFSLPEDGDCPIIMVGPGTGIAPFLAFLEEHEVRSGKGDTWLFFGDRNAATDFLYEAELNAYLSRGGLTRLDLAFSRDQKSKIYVQARMRENGAELFAWLERGARFYVCGDAKNMAKDVNLALCDIIERHGGFSSTEAHAYVDKLKRDKRYLSDVY